MEAVVDLTNATIQGIDHNAYDTAHALTWMILTFYVPVLWVTVVVIAWQLTTRGHELAHEARRARDGQRPAARLN